MLAGLRLPIETILFDGQLQVLPHFVTAQHIAYRQTDLFFAMPVVQWRAAILKRQQADGPTPLNLCKLSFNRFEYLPWWPAPCSNARRPKNVPPMTRKFVVSSFEMSKGVVFAWAWVEGELRGTVQVQFVGAKNLVKRCVQRPALVVRIRKIAKKFPPARRRAERGEINAAAAAHWHGCERALRRLHY